MADVLTGNPNTIQLDFVVRWTLAILEHFFGQGLGCHLCGFVLALGEQQNVVATCAGVSTYGILYNPIRQDLKGVHSFNQPLP